MSGLEHVEIMRVKSGLMCLGPRSVVKASNRFMIWLPIHLNGLWEELRRTKKKVKVYVEI